MVKFDRIVGRGVTLLCCSFLLFPQLRNLIPEKSGVSQSELVEVIFQGERQIITASYNYAIFVNPNIIVTYRNPIPTRTTASIKASISFPVLHKDTSGSTSTIVESPKIPDLMSTPWPVAITASSPALDLASETKEFPEGTTLPIETEWSAASHDRGEYSITLKVDNMLGNDSPCDIPRVDPHDRFLLCGHQEYFPPGGLQISANGKQIKLNSSNEITLPLSVRPFGVFSRRAWDLMLILGAFIGLIVGSGLVPSALNIVLARTNRKN